MAMWKKSFLDHFCTTKNLYLPPILGDHAGGQIWPFLKIDFQDPKNGPKSDFSAFSAKQKLLEI